MTPGFRISSRNSWSAVIRVHSRSPRREGSLWSTAKPPSPLLHPERSRGKPGAQSEGQRTPGALTPPRCPLRHRGGVRAPSPVLCTTMWTRSHYLLIYLLLLISIFIFYWSIVNLQRCVSSRYTAKWFSYTHTHTHTYICIFYFRLFSHLGYTEH